MSRVVGKRLYSSGSQLLKTPLYDCHVEFGGKMVPYAGFEMPVLYKGQTHTESHNWVRNNVGLFDVSHMLQHRISGKDVVDFLQKVTPINLSELDINSSSLSVLLNEQGGIIDDCIITKHGENEYYMVSNAGCREKDVAFLKKELQNFNDVNHDTFEGTLLAIQGPKAAEILQKFTNENLKSLTFGKSKFSHLSSIINSQVHFARCGYTGEDGFELSIPSSTAQETKESQEFFRLLINEYPDIVKPIGLAARDSLRLEAGMCLYGHELNESKTPIEATLAWLIPKSRRQDDATFNGASNILAQIKDRSLITHKRVGIKAKGPSPRDDCKVFAADGKEEIGYITSGAPSPTIGGNVAQAYVKNGLKIGTDVKIEIRGKLRDGVISKMPFVPSNYYRG